MRRGRPLEHKMNYGASWSLSGCARRIGRRSILFTPLRGGRAACALLRGGTAGHIHRQSAWHPVRSRLSVCAQSYVCFPGALCLSYMKIMKAEMGHCTCHSSKPCSAAAPHAAGAWWMSCLASSMRSAAASWPTSRRWWCMNLSAVRSGTSKCGVTRLQHRIVTS